VELVLPAAAIDIVRTQPRLGENPWGGLQPWSML